MAFASERAYPSTRRLASQGGSLYILILAIVIAVLVALSLSFGPVARSARWSATVTPLASIIGSGFLICGPLLAKEFGSAAVGAEVILLAIAYAMGAVMRFNILHVEDYLEASPFNDRIAWLARISQVVLALAYAVSVAYYLKLLAEFGLRPLHVDPAHHALASNILVTVIIGGLISLAFFGNLKRVEGLAHGTVAVKLGIIAGMMVALAASWITRGAHAPAPPTVINLHSLPMLLGLLITVQGFETSRYLGYAYDKQTRIVTMRRAQWISSAIYAAFLLLLTPFLSQAAATPGVAGILDIMESVAPFLGLLVLAGAISSQMSAAVADSIGAGGLMNEVSQKRLSVPVAFVAAAGLSLVLVWITDPFQVIALSSRAFAVFYALQCGLGLWVSLRTGHGGRWARAGMVVVGLVCLTAAAVGAPAE